MPDKKQLLRFAEAQRRTGNKYLAKDCQLKRNHFAPDRLHLLLLFKAGISAIELLDPPGGIHYFLFSSKKRVTL